MEIENTNQPQIPIQAPNQNQPLSSEDQPKQSRKIIVVLAIIVVLLLAFGVGGYFLGVHKNQTRPPYQQVTTPSVNIIQPSPTNTPMPIEDSTTNWKTYTNSDFGISLKYPVDAVASTKTLYSMLSKSSNGLEIVPPYQEPYSKWYTFDLVVQDNPQNLDAKTIIKNYAEDIKKNCSPPACSTPKMITDTLKPYKNGDINGYIFHIGAETDSAMVVYVKSNKTYIFRMSGDQGNVTDYGLNIFDQILSTLKFTK